MTVSENMVFGLKLRKFPQPEIKRRLAEAAAILEIEPLLDRKPAALSPAERFRANLARAVARQPKVFLFEEPLATLDPALRPRMRAEILRLHHRLQATMIYASHDPLDAMTMGQRAVIMRDGVIQQTGAPLALYREPDNLFVAGYLGAPPMNFIHGKLREAGETLVFKESGEGILEFKFPATTAAKPFAGREVIAGVRPESIPIITSPVPAKAAAPVYKALLDIVEPMGAETQAHIETGAHRIIARTPAAVPAEEAGHRVQFEIDPAAVHLFDPESTKRITD
jgi:multiple sugar transport system ATP-binding protein